MKPLLYLSLAVLTLTVRPHACWADEKREEKPRFKGAELYSWKDKEGNWMFVLLNGTNRLKTEEEVKGAKNKIKGAAELKKALARLAVGEQVTWTHPIPGFEFPPEDTRKAIEKAAEEADVKLSGGPKE
jgi:hypothetical protein